MINGRPITKVSDDPRDHEPLTANNLSLLQSGPTLPPGWINKKDGYSRSRWKQVQYLVDVFQRRWIREYMPTLQERRKWGNENRNFAVNNVVLVLDDHVPCSYWSLGRILEVHQRKRDGMVISVTVKTSVSVLVRPIDKIVQLIGA